MAIQRSGHLGTGRPGVVLACVLALGAAAAAAGQSRGGGRYAAGGRDEPRRGVAAGRITGVRHFATPQRELRELTVQTAPGRIVTLAVDPACELMIDQAGENSPPATHFVRAGVRAEVVWVERRDASTGGRIGHAAERVRLAAEWIDGAINKLDRTVLFALALPKPPPRMEDRDDKIPVHGRNKPAPPDDARSSRRSQEPPPEPRRVTLGLKADVTRLTLEGRPIALNELKAAIDESSEEPPLRFEALVLDDPAHTVVELHAVRTDRDEAGWRPPKPAGK